LVIAATAGFALTAAASQAGPAAPSALYPMCSFGTVIFLPFPGETDEEPQNGKSACHARLNDRLRLIRAAAKRR